jgi:DNA-binding NarL/FixJ family response regulator
MINLDVHVLLVENNLEDALMISELITTARSEEPVKPVIHLVHACSENQALSILSRQPVDVIIFDLNERDSDSMCVATSQLSSVSRAPVIIINDSYDESLALHAIQSGALDFLIKNRLDGVELLRTIIYATECKRIERALHIKMTALLDIA